MRIVADPRLGGVSFLGAVAGLIVFVGAAGAQPGPPADDVTLPELIVLLRAGDGMPDPQSIVEAVQRGRLQDLPPGLAEGNPQSARLAVTRRRGRGQASNQTLEWIEQNSDRPLSRLGRYVVLGYDRREANLQGLANSLRRHAVVENVERNYYFRLSAAFVPDDPLVGNPGDPPEVSQRWVLDALNVFNAWGRGVRGTATVGIVDTGVWTQHNELRAFREDPVTGEVVYNGGAFRSHLDLDLRHNDCDTDEMDPQDGLPERDQAGHGTHVAGSIVARTNNGESVAGLCWGCSLIVAKAFSQDDTEIPSTDFQTPADIAAMAVEELINKGAQIINMSFGVNRLATGIGPVSCDETNPDLVLDIFCQVLALAEERDVVMTAAPGNDRTNVIEFPASDERVISVGAVQFDATAGEGYSFWEEDVCPFVQGPFECGSNFGAEQDLSAPGRQILSTMYMGFNHSGSSINTCGDVLNVGDAADGQGPCTGTSMSAAQGAGAATLPRSVNPLLRNEEIHDALVTTASRAGSWDPKAGYGVPDVDAAVARTLGQIGGEVIANRLTPLFCLYSDDAQTHVCTVSPTTALAFVFDAESPFTSVGPPAPGYPVFVPEPCSISPCGGTPTGASLYVFTSDAPPFPGAPPLVPLFRMRFDPDLVDPANPNRCIESPTVANRDFTFTTEVAGIERFHGLGYQLDAVEGYIFQKCEPEPDCIPVGAVRVMRLYHPSLDDYAIFPESEEAEMRARGYISQSTLSDFLGYAYPAVDSDGDDVVDGFELLLGTDPALTDSDCDGKSDGEEILVYDMSSPDPAQHGYGDALDGDCSGAIFFNGFETGDTSLWSDTVP